jgi:3',5'-cyclic AMP phosphodiesterase CpdA
MLTIVHGSDLHFGKAHDAAMAGAFHDVVMSLEPDLLVLSGDFTQRAKIREYEEAREYLERFASIPTVVTPGNHDVPLYRVWERIFAPFRNYQEHVSPGLDTVTRVRDAVVVSLNSAAPHQAVVNGRIRRGQLEFAARAFADAGPGIARILVTHHHFASAPDYERDKVLPNAAAILDTLSQMEVELVLGGHLHRAYIGNSLDVSPGQDRDHGIVIVHCGTTTSTRGRARERARNSFNVVRIVEEYLEITHFMYFEDRQGFAPFSVHAFPRRRDRYFPRDPFRSHMLLKTAEGAP